jgi:hypothetical protein
VVRELYQRKERDLKDMLELTKADAKKVKSILREVATILHGLAINMDEGDNIKEIVDALRAVLKKFQLIITDFMVAYDTKPTSRSSEEEVAAEVINVFAQNGYDDEKDMTGSMIAALANFVAATHGTKRSIDITTVHVAIDEAYKRAVQAYQENTELH